MSFKIHTKLLQNKMWLFKNCEEKENTPLPLFRASLEVILLLRRDDHAAPCSSFFFSSSLSSVLLQLSISSLAGQKLLFFSRQLCLPQHAIASANSDVKSHQQQICNKSTKQIFSKRLSPSFIITRKVFRKSPIGMGKAWASNHLKSKSSQLSLNIIMQQMTCHSEKDLA